MKKSTIIPLAFLIIGIIMVSCKEELSLIERVEGTYLADNVTSTFNDFDGRMAEITFTEVSMDMADVSISYNALDTDPEAINVTDVVLAEGSNEDVDFSKSFANAEISGRVFRDSIALIIEYQDGNITSMLGVM